MTDFGTRKTENAANPSITNPTTPSPEALSNAPNRGDDNAFTSQSAPPLEVTLANVNQVVLHYMRNRISPTIMDNGISRVVPIVYGTPERWASVRKDGVYRDPEDAKILKPLIAIHRVRESRDQLRNPVNKYLYEEIDPGWNPKQAYDRFTVQNAMRPSKLIRTVLMPDYMRLTYDVILWADYQEQMDQMIEQINFEAEDYWGDRNYFKFRVMIEEYMGASNLPAAQDRVLRSEFQMTVHAYLLPTKALKNFHYTSTTREAYTPKKVIFAIGFSNSIKPSKGPVQTDGVNDFEQQNGKVY